MTTEIQYPCETNRLAMAFSVVSRHPIPLIDDHLAYFHMLNFTQDIPEKEQILLFHDVFSHFSYEMWPIRFLSTEERDAAYFKIAFVSPDDMVYPVRGTPFKSPFSFRSNPGVLAVAYPRNHSRWDGWVLINDSFFWDTIHQGGKKSLYITLKHEIAHALGIGHTDHPNDIMAPIYNHLARWTSDSIAAINHLYGDIRLRIAQVRPQAAIFFKKQKRKGCFLFRKSKKQNDGSTSKKGKAILGTQVKDNQSP